MGYPRLVHCPRVTVIESHPVTIENVNIYPSKSAENISQNGSDRTGITEESTPDSRHERNWAKVNSGYPASISRQETHIGGYVMNPWCEEYVDEKRNRQDAEGQATQCGRPTRNEHACFIASLANTPGPAVRIFACGDEVRDRVKVPCNGASRNNELVI